MIYSKTYCPFCNRVKSLFASLDVDVTVAELDQIVEGEQIQDILASLTGQRTVPSVFIGGEHIGGCDDTHQLHASGELEKLIEAASSA